MPAQSSRSIGFLMLVGSSLTLCGIICNNNAMLSPGFLRYDPSKSNYGLLVTIEYRRVLFAFPPTNTLKSRQSLSCLCGTAEAPLGMPEATPTTHEAALREYKMNSGARDAAQTGGAQTPGYKDGEARSRLVLS